MRGKSFAPVALVLSLTLAMVAPTLAAGAPAPQAAQGAWRELVASVRLGNIKTAEGRAEAGQEPRPKLSVPTGDREEWQMSARVMDEIGVRPGMTVADVGAGDGWFTIRLADRVGTSGRVIAEDIDVPAMNALREDLAARGAANVSVVVGEPKDPKLPAGTVDVALMVNVLTALGNINTTDFLGNLAKALKPDGRLVIIDWDPVKSQQVTAQEFEPELAKILRRLRDADFEVVKTLDFLPLQSLRICVLRGHGTGAK